MGKLLVKVGLFLGPLVLLLSAAEFYLRHHNTFYFKSEYTERHGPDAEVLFLGSSHTHRAIDPLQMEVPAVNLANGGSAMNLDHLMAEKFIPRLPALKVVFLELSYHSLERIRESDYAKNNLYKIYYGIDNYGHAMPLWDRFLITSNLPEYVKIIWQDVLYPKKINAAGFMEVDPGPIKSRFSYLEYDSVRIRETQTRYLYGRHKNEDRTILEANVDRIRQVQALCAERGIRLVLLSPPKYYLYNDANLAAKRERRDSVANLFMGEGVPFWNYERAMEHEVTLFANEDHLNPDGAAIFSSVLDKRLQGLPHFSSQVGRVRQVVD